VLAVLRLPSAKGVLRDALFFARYGAPKPLINGKEFVIDGCVCARDIV